MKSFILFVVVSLGSFFFAWAQLPWQQVHNVVPYPHALYTIASDSAYVYAYSMENSSGRLYRSAAKGAPGTWTEITTDPTDMNTWGARLYKSGQYLYLLESICFDAVLHRSTDSGITWTIPDPTFGKHLYFSRLEFLSDTNILAVGGSLNNVYRSTDHGDSWTMVLTTGMTAFGTNASILGKSSSAYVIMDSSVHVSTDYGATWTSHSTNVFQDGRTVLLSDGSFLRSAGNALYTSADAVNWVAKPISGVPTVLSYTTSFQKSPTSDSLFWILTDYSSNHDLLYSADNGATWANFESGLTIPPQTINNYWMYDLHISTNGYMYASVQGGGIYRTWPDYTSVAEAETKNSTFNIYPNPAGSMLHINMHLQQPQEGTVTIYDMLGKVISAQAYNAMAGQGKVTIDISQLPSGNYLASVTSRDSHATRKFVKQ